MTASDRAAEKLKDELLRRFLNTGLGYRVVVDTSAPEQTTIGVKLDNERPGDEVLASHGIRVFLDQLSADLLRDCELDYQDGPAGGFCLKKGKEVTANNQVSQSLERERTSDSVDSRSVEKLEKEVQYGDSNNTGTIGKRGTGNRKAYR